MNAFSAIHIPNTIEHPSYYDQTINKKRHQICLFENKRQILTKTKNISFFALAIEIYS